MKNDYGTSLSGVKPWSMGLLLALLVSLLVAAEPEWHAARSLPHQKGVDPINVRKASTALGDLSFEMTFPEISMKATDAQPNATSSTEKITLGAAPQRVLTGEPVIPVVPMQIVLPAGFTVKKVSVRAGKKIDVPGVHQIEHGKVPMPYSRYAPRIETPPNLDIYEKNNPYPLSRADCVSIQKKQGVTIAVLTVNPVVYYPKSGKVVRYENLTLDIATEPDPSYGKNPSYHPVRTELFGSVENPEDIGTYQTTNAPSGASLSEGICNPAETYRYVIITSTALRDATTDYTLRDLVAYKKSCGITATIVTTESIYAVYAGSDNQERIRAFIKDAYSNWKTDYVLLGGDVATVPVRMLYDAAEGGTAIPSDLYYQCLDGSYNSDGDSYWGEPHDGPGGTDVDLMAELAVGRASAENATEMSNFVYKTVAYAKENDATPSLRAACMVGEFLGSQFGSGAYGYAYPYMKEIHYGSRASGYITKGFAASPVFTVDSIDDYCGIWPAAQIVASMNSGDISIYNHLGHGSENYVMKLRNSDIDALVNKKPFFIYSQGCYSGDLTGDCSAEHFTTSQRSGAFAVVFNSRYGWGGYNTSDTTLDGPSQRFNRQFWDACFGESIVKFGDANADSHEDNIWDINGSYIRWCMYETNLFGDPELPIRGTIAEPYVHVLSSTINDAAGNGDGCINPGEQIVLAPELINSGTTDANDVTVHLTTSDPFITISNPTIAAGRIDCCGATSSSANGIVFTVAPECPTPHTLSMILTATDNSSSWSTELQLNVYSSTQVRGTVTAKSTAQPVAGALVQYSGPLSGSVRTNAAGEYMFGAIGGTYGISVSAPQFLPSQAVTVAIPSNNQSVNFELVRPEISVTPASLNVSLPVDATADKTVTIANTGDAPLTYSIEMRNSGSNRVALAEQCYDQAHFVEMQKGVYDTRIGSSVMLPYGGPDAYGYRWIDSDQKSGPAFTWNDIGSTGTLLASVSGCDDCSQLQDLSFPFPFYGTRFTSVFVNSNGNISFGTGSSQHANYPLPSSTMPAYLIAPFFDDLNPAAGGNIYFKDFGDRAVFQYTDVASYSGSGLATFQIVIDQEGAITFYYKTVPVTTTSATIGIQNGTRTDGLTIAYNTNFLKNSFAVRLTSRPFWLAVAPGSGTIPPGSTATVSVAFSSVHCFGGIQTAVMEIAHNDPLHGSPVVVPCTIAVDGVRRLAVSPASYTFPPQYTYLSTDATFDLVNTGTEPTTVSSVACTNKCFTLKTALPLVVPPAGSQPIIMSYVPSESGSHTGVVTIVSDAESQQLYSLSLDGSALAPPSISVAPPLLSAATVPGGGVSNSLMVQNTGGGDLAFSLHAFANNPPLGKTLDILAWVPFTDLQGEYLNMVQAIGAYTVNFTISNSITFSASELETQLVNKEVFLVMEQELSNIPAGTGTAFAAVLQSFLSRGGTIIYCCPGYNGNTTEFLHQAGLMDLSFVTTATSGNCTIEQPGHELFRNVEMPLTIQNATSCCTVLDGSKVLASYNNSMVVGENRVGLGRVITIGLDFYMYTPGWARLLSNAVETARSNVPWLSFGQDNGTVSSGGSLSIPVQFSATSLEPGIYKATLEISHNATLQSSPLTVPVTFIVSVAGGADHSRILSIGTSAQNIARGTSYSLGAILIGSPVAGNVHGNAYKLYLK